MESAKACIWNVTVVSLPWWWECSNNKTQYTHNCHHRHHQWIIIDKSLNHHHLLLFSIIIIIISTIIMIMMKQNHYSSWTLYFSCWHGSKNTQKGTPLGLNIVSKDKFSQNWCVEKSWLGIPNGIPYRWEWPRPYAHLFPSSSSDSFYLFTLSPNTTFTRVYTPNTCHEIVYHNPHEVFIWFEDYTILTKK